jgi:hypothetical protein
MLINVSESEENIIAAATAVSSNKPKIVSNSATPRSFCFGNLAIPPWTALLFQM